MLTIIILCIIIYRYAMPAPLVPPHLKKFLSVGANKQRTIPQQNLRESVKRANSRRHVRNSELYGPVDRDTVVIVILVHRDLERLRYLIVSLARVRHVSTALLVFSHSYYDENVEALVRLIDFAMVLQIYYPHSVQLFPGGCGAAERKHHWWWTANFAFEMLPWADVHEEMSIFMDEAAYVLPDFLHVFRFAKRALAYVPDAEVLSFGRSLAGGLAYDRLLVDSWRPHFAKGVALNASVWRRVRSLGGRFCEYEDTSWSHSLLHVFRLFGGGRALSVSSMAPRVLSTDTFRGGRHAAVSVRLAVDEALLFPDVMKTIVLFRRNGKVVRENESPRRGNGGQTDSRYLKLCLAHAHNLSTTFETDL